MSSNNRAAQTGRSPKPEISETIAALQMLRAAEGQAPVSATIYYGLSGLTSEELAEIMPVWQALADDERRRIIRFMVDVGEVNFDLDYVEFGNAALQDPDAEVREAAIELLFDDMSIEHMDRLLELAQWDEAPSVRAAAVGALGRFILAGEYEEIPASAATRAEEVAISLWSNDSEDVDVRRRALEAIANSSHEIVPEAIEEAYQSFETRMRVSALFAMGRTNDRMWSEYVMRELNSDDPEMRYEAARAAGELSLRKAVQSLIRLASGSDREIAEVAIWSLGEIGGEQAKRALSMLAQQAEQAEDDELVEAVEDALASAELVDVVAFDDEDFDEDDF